MAHHGRGGLGALLAVLALGCLAASPPAASGAEFGIEPGSFKARLLDSDDNQESRAGSHPDRLQIDFGFSLEGSGTTPRDLVFELPPGFAGDPGAVPDCPRALFDQGEGECPPETQVGLLRFAVLEGPEIELPIFELEPTADEVIAFGSRPGTGVTLAMQLRPDDFGVSLQAVDLAEVPIEAGHAELWGIPADHQQGTDLPPRPFLTAPTRCGPLSFTFRTRSWEENAPWLSATTEAEAPLTGCESLSFRPQLGLQLGNPVADSPSGLSIEVSAPEEAEGSTRADAQMKDVTVELPAGVTISPSGAEGLAACSDAQLGLGNADPALCPPSSLVGAVELSSPALPEPLTGSLYLGEEHPGERFRLLVVAPAPGVVVKLAGAMRADPLTGRLSAVLRELPQVPITRLSIRIDGGSEALLATPLDCGSSTATGSFAPYGGAPDVSASASVAIAGRGPGWRCPGPGPFGPRLVVSSANPAAGRPTSLSTTLLREPGEQLPRKFSIALPPGLSASLGSVEACPAASSAVACPAASRIGEALVKAGSGPLPVALPGDLYLTGPYRGAPFSLLVQARAAVGPFDLGTIAFRARLELEARTGRVTVISDPLPEAIEGMPVRFQAIELRMDRPGFIRNPTSCRPARVDAAIEAQGGASTVAASTLALRGCRKLGFRPRFRVVLEGGGASSRSPAVQVSARMRRGDARLRSLTISLPQQLRFDVAQLEEICSRHDALAGSCPDGSRVGTTKAQTELLDEPLHGVVHVAQPSGTGQPDLWFSLRAAGVAVELRARTAIRDGHLITKLQGLPDMPLRALTMHLGGRDGGVLSLAGGACRHGRPRDLVAALDARAQNGSRRRLRVPIAVEARCP